MKPPLLWSLALLALLAPLQAQSINRDSDPKEAKEKAERAKLDSLAKGTGAAMGMCLLECYLALTDAERALGTKAASSFRRHLEIQPPLLELLKKHCNEIDAAFPDDKDMGMYMARIREAIGAIIAQNEAVVAYIDGESKNLEGIRKKHAATKALLIPLLQLKNNGADIP